jgi:cytidine deaminase
MENKYFKYKSKYLNLKKHNHNNLNEEFTFLNMKGGVNVVENLDERDEMLLEKVNAFVNEHCNDEFPLGTGMLHESGHIIYGVSIKNPMGNDVHGEHAAISAARVFDKDKTKYVSIVSLTRSEDRNYKIKAPCGICRELLRYHYPNMYSLVPHPITKKIVKVISKYLLPYPYMSTKLPEESKLEEQNVFINPTVDINRVER